MRNRCNSPYRYNNIDNTNKSNYSYSRNNRSRSRERSPYRNYKDYNNDRNFPNENYHNNNPNNNNKNSLKSTYLDFGSSDSARIRKSQNLKFWVTINLKKLRYKSTRKVDSMTRSYEVSFTHSVIRLEFESNLYSLTPRRVEIIK